MISDEAKTRAKAARALNSRVVRAYLLAHPCVGCGEDDPTVLEFDHIQESDKLRAISEMVHKCLSLEAIFKEIAKTQVRCSNCHARRTANRRIRAEADHKKC